MENIDLGLEFFGLFGNNKKSYTQYNELVDKIRAKADEIDKIYKPEMNVLRKCVAEMKKNGEYNKPAFDGESNTPEDHYKLPSGTILENLPLFNKNNVIKFFKDGKDTVLKLFSSTDYEVAFKEYKVSMNKWNNSACGTKFLYDYNTDYIGFDKDKLYTIGKDVLNDTDIHVYTHDRDRCKVEDEYMNIVYKHKTTDMVNYLHGVYEYFGSQAKRDLYELADNLSKLIKVNENGNGGKGVPLTGKLSLHFKFIKLAIESYLGIFSCFNNLTSDIEEYEMRYKVEDYYGMESYEPGLEFFGALKRMFGPKDMIAKHSNNLSWSMKRASEVAKWAAETRGRYQKAYETCKNKGILKNKAFPDPSDIDEAVHTTLGPIIKFHNACNGNNLSTFLDTLYEACGMVLISREQYNDASRSFDKQIDQVNILQRGWLKAKAKMITLPMYKAFATDFKISKTHTIVGLSEGKVEMLDRTCDDPDTRNDDLEDADYEISFSDDVRLVRESNEIISNYAKWTIEDCLVFVKTIADHAIHAEQEAKTLIEDYKKMKPICDIATNEGKDRPFKKMLVENACETFDGSIASYVGTLHTLKDHADKLLWVGVKQNLEGSN